MDKSIYRPREDSFLLERWVGKLCKNKVLDMGTGSGILARAALANDCEVLAADLNPKAVEHCKQHIAEQGSADSSKSRGIDAILRAQRSKRDESSLESISEHREEARGASLRVVQSDVFSNIKGKFDWIVFNPPYLPVLGGEDYHVALMVANTGVIERFLAEAKNYLNGRGKILLLFSSLTNNVLELASENNYASTLLEKQTLDDGEELYVYLLSARNE